MLFDLSTAKLAANFHISTQLISLAMTFEGFSATAYDDGTHVLTIGYGHIEQVKAGDICTKDEATNWLYSDMAIAAGGVQRLVTAPINQNMFDALCDFTFNVGAHNLQRSTLLARLNSSDYEAAYNEFPKWVFAGGRFFAGLEKRRLAEQKLFAS